MSSSNRRGCLIVGSLTLAVVVWLQWPRQHGDPLFDASVERPTYADRHPRILFDEGHWNGHKTGNRYKPFADLARNDGYEVVPSEDELTSEALGEADILVSANPLGFVGSMQHLANLLRLEKLVSLPADAFSKQEVVAVETWVRGGGSLLLVADHAPCGLAAHRLSERFGVGMTNLYAEDIEQYDPVFGNTSFVVFSTENGTLADHPITRGRVPEEHIAKVITYTGQSLVPPPGSAPLLVFSPTSRSYPYRRGDDNKFKPAFGLAQAVALEHGKGRVVVFGEAAALSSQTFARPGISFKLGMARVDADNRQLVLNVLHWLSRGI